MDTDLFERERQLRIQAGQVMQELRARGEDWQVAWRDHPVAIAYRKLLADAWRRPHQTNDPRYRKQN